MSPCYELIVARLGSGIKDNYHIIITCGGAIRSMDCNIVVVVVRFLKYYMIRYSPSLWFDNLIR